MSHSSTAAHAPRRLRDDLGFGLERQLAHADEVLCDLGQALLVLVNEELGPVSQVLIHLAKRFQIVAACTPHECESTGAVNAGRSTV